VTRGRVDGWALAATVLAVVTAVGYLALLREQDGEPALWFLALVVLGAVGAGTGAVRSAPHRRATLAVAAVLLGACGLLGILTIGMPLLVASVLSLVSLARSPAAARDGAGAGA